MSHEVKILGAGCAKCRATHALLAHIIAAEALDGVVTKVDDMAEIAAHGIMSTPGILVDGEMKAVGRVPGRAEIRQWLS